MENFSISDVVTINRDIRAGRSEDGPFICSKGEKGIVVEIEASEWDGVHVKLENEDHIISYEIDYTISNNDRCVIIKDI